MALIAARPSPLALVVCLALLCASGTARAQTFISGPLSDATTGPLTPGVYRVTNHISVPAAATLTVQAGVIVKFQPNLHFTLSGTLDVQAAQQAEPVARSEPAVLIAVARNLTSRGVPRLGDLHGRVARHVAELPRVARPRPGHQVGTRVLALS